MSEIYLESLRYLAGTKTPNPDFAAGTKDAALGLTVVSPWDDPISQNNYCAPLNVLNFNASVSSYDDDQLAGLSDLGTTTSAEDLTKLVGDLELITGKDWFVGNVSGGSTNDLCSSKTIPNFGRIYGVCPEAPAQQGTYLMSGIAYYAHTNRIRSDLKVPTGKEYADALKVTTYGIALATNVPKIEVKVNGKTVTILPAYRLDSSSVGNGPFGGGTLVDFKIVEQTPTHGKFYVNWEDSEMGGDYDQDMWGVIEYAVSGNNITITTDAVSASTGNGQGFGYIISGTDKDGPHFHSGIYDFDYIDPISGVIGCSNCKVGDAPTSVTYAVTGNSGGALNDPLWYAAKYGGFSDSDDDGTPNQVQEWDAVKNATGDPGQDSVPDNFFHVTNPLALERALNSAFLKILRDSSASAVATNSSSLNTGSRVYQGRFSNTAWSGQILSYRLDETTGQLIDTQVLPSPNWDASEKPYPEWDAGYLLNSQTSRLILTSADTGSGWVGAEFDYGNLGATQKGFLDRDMYVYLDSCGPERVAYLRGDRSSEGTGTFTCASSSVIQRFRERNVSILGDVINSNPIYVGPPNAGYAEAVHPGYTAFRQGFGARKPVLYVGANDGMLHGFDVSVDAANNVPTSTSGREVLAYVPSMVYGNLSRLTDRDYSANGNHRYFVDSSPMVADVCTSNCNASSAVWKTLLVGGLGAGGKGYYALNVTNPDVSSKDAAATPMFSSIQAANIVQWEFRADATGDAMGLGYTFNSAPTRSNNGQAKQMAKFENGRWGIVVGNGYNSAQGKAILYVLFVQGPTGTGGVWQAGGVDYVRIEADAGPDNGLSTPVPFDSDGDGKADTVYAGDLKGNLWKFDLSDPSASNWNATKVSLLFKATDASNNPQPIVSVPEVTLHPAGGRMVLFGTGKFLEQGDTTSTSVQSFYGIHDLGATVTGRGNLVPQVIDAVNRTVVQGCGTSPLPSCPTTVEGWYADLPESGERLTGSPQLLAGSIFFNTFIPSITPCEFGGTGYLMGLDYVTGAMLVPSIFDTNQDGKIDGNDTSAGGIKVGAALGGTTLIRGTVNSSAGTGGTASSTVGVGVSSTTDGSTSSDLIDFGAGSRGRISWREIVQ
jgi:type IV pilus assembly protein PilY1